MITVIFSDSSCKQFNTYQELILHCMQFVSSLDMAELAAQRRKWDALNSATDYISKAMLNNLPVHIEAIAARYDLSIEEIQEVYNDQLDARYEDF